MVIANIDFNKFETIFQSMEKQLVMQTSFLESMYNLNVESMIDARRSAALASASSIDNRIGGGATALVADNRFSRNQPSGGDAGGGGLGGFIGKIFGVLGSISPAMLGPLLSKGGKLGLVAMMAPMVGSFIEGTVSKSLSYLEENMGTELPEAFKTSFATTLGDAAKWGTMGKVIGGRLGGVFAAGGFAYDTLMANLDVGNDGNIKSGFLEGFDAQNVSGIGGALGSALTLALPSILPAILGPIVGLLTGPIGLTAFAGAAIVGGATLLGNYLDEKRSEFIKEINARVADGISEISKEGDVGIFRGLGIKMGFSDPTNTSEDLVNLEAVASNYKNTVTGGRGPLSPEMAAKAETIDWKKAKDNLDPSAYSSLVKQAEAIKASIETPGFLTTLSESQLTQLRSLSKLFGHANSVSLIDKAVEAAAARAEAASRAQGTPEYDMAGNITGYTTPLPEQTSGSLADSLTSVTADVSSAKVSTLQSTAAQEASMKNKGLAGSIINAPTSVGGATNIQQGGSVTINNWGSPHASLDMPAYLLS